MTLLREGEAACTGRRRARARGPGGGRVLPYACGHSLGCQSAANDCRILACARTAQRASMHSRWSWSRGSLMDCGSSAASGTPRLTHDRHHEPPSIGSPHPGQSNCGSSRSIASARALIRWRRRYSAGLMNCGSIRSPDIVVRSRVGPGVVPPGDIAGVALPDVTIGTVRDNLDVVADELRFVSGLRHHHPRRRAGSGALSGGVRRPGSADSRTNSSRHHRRNGNRWRGCSTAGGYAPAR